MKNIIKTISSFLLIFLFSTCKYTTKKEKKITNKLPVEIEIDTSNNKINYLIKIVTNKCSKKDSLLSIPIEESKSHFFDVFEEDQQYCLFYEYTSVRPVHIETMYIDKNSLKIDSIVKGFFNFEKTDYDFEKILNDKEICNYNFENFIK